MGRDEEAEGKAGDLTGIGVSSGWARQGAASVVATVNHSPCHCHCVWVCVCLCLFVGQK